MSGFDQLLSEVGTPLTAAPAPIPETDETPTPEKITPASDAAPEVQQPTPEPAQQVDQWKVLSERLGQQFTGEEDFSQWHTEVSATKQQLEEYKTREQQWAAEKEELAKGVDPMQYFASPELFVMNGLLKMFPEKNPMALTEISTRDFSKTYLESPMEVLALNLMLDHPGIYSNKAEAMEDLQATYGIDDMDEIEAKAKRRMQVDAKTAIDKFAEIKAKITPPAPVDLTAQRAAKLEAEQQRITKMTEATNTLFTKTIPDQLKAIVVPLTIKGEDGKDATEIAFKYDIPESYAKSKAVQQVIAQVRNATIQNEAEWTPAKEAALNQDVTELLQAMYLKKNLTEIYVAIREDLQTKFKDEAWMKRHNVRQLRTDGTAPATTDKARQLEQNQRDIAKSMGIKNL